MTCSRSKSPIEIECPRGIALVRAVLPDLPALGEAGRELQRCFSAYVEAGERGQPISLDEAFGLAVFSGGESWIVTEARARRNEALCRCAEIIAPGHSFSMQADSLRSALIRYEQTRWPLDKNRTHVRAGDEGSKYEFLWRAYRENCGRMPTGVSRLKEILRGCS